MVDAGRDGPRHVRRTVQWLALAGCTVFVAFVWTLTLGHLSRARDEEIRQAQSDVVNLSVAVSQQVSRMVEGADQAMRMVATARAADPDGFAFDTWAGAAAPPGKSGLTLAMFDAAGELTRTNVPFRPLSVADREYFKALAANPDAGLYVGRTVRSRLNEGYAFVLARRLTDADGTFRGIVTGSFDPAHLASGFEDLDVGPDGSVALYGLDGHLRARAPEVAGMFEANLPRTEHNRELFSHLSTSQKGTYTVKSALDGHERVYGFKAIEGLPLVVSVGKSLDAVLVPYVEEERRTVGVASAATFAALAIFLASLFEAERARKRERNLAEAHDVAARAEARYRLLAENASDMIVRLSPDGLRTYVSPASRDLLGVEPEALVGTDLSHGVHPGDAAGLRAGVASLSDGGRDILVHTHRLLHGDGRWVWAEASWRVLRDADGSLLGYVASVRDVDARERAQEEIRASRVALEEKTALLELAQAAAGAGTFDYDLGSHTVRMSREGARLHGMADEEVVIDNARWQALCVPEDAARVMANVRAAVENHVTMHSEYRVPLPDGSVRWVVGIGRTYYDERGGPVRMIGLNLDATDRKEAEHALVHAKAEADAARVAAEQASAAKTEFLATMSHEVRTPLNAVIGYTGLLAESDRLDGDLRRHAELARSAGSALLLVVNDILEFSKIEAGQVELSPAPFMVRSMADNCVSIVRGSVASRPVDVRMRVDGDMPECLVGDEGRLRQVLLNLLNNAVKFTPEGSVVLQLRHEASTTRGESVRIAVTDTGIGIPRERLHRLFQRFSQVDGSVSRDYGGTGLGLAICKGLVEAMGGEIGVFSEPGRGSTFWVSLALPRGSVPRPVAPTASAGDLRGKLLLVEDVDINRELATMILVAAGHEVDSVEDGRAAVDAVRDGAYDLVLMDVQMPGMDGMTATRLIRALDGPARDVPIVAMTANVLPNEVAAFRESGMDDHVGKPFDRDALYATIQRWLARRGEPSLAARRARAG